MARLPAGMARAGMDVPLIVAPMFLVSTVGVIAAGLPQRRHRQHPRPATPARRNPSTAG
jgi:hypothetical protein